MRRMIVVSRYDSAPGRKRRPARKPPRRRPLRPWQRPAVRYGALALALTAGSGVWLWSSGRATAGLDGARLALIDASAAVGLTVREVFVTGRERTPRAALLEALGVERGAPLVTVDPAAARGRLEALGWVREATVERRFPDTVFVRLSERAPLALWQRRGELFVVDRDGIVIDGAEARKFARLPIIVGDDAPAHAVDLLTVMASEPVLRERVKAAIRVGGRRWNLRLDNGIDVQLPEEGIAEAWRRLAEYDRRHSLLAREIAGVDLRLPDRLVLRPAPAADDSKRKGEST
ncbi:MAG: cell division protein FtsQ/DivIB [Alphaproteobacteria bacterium]